MIISNTQLAVVKFGKLWTSKTPYYEVVDKDNNVLIARTNSNVVEHGEGVYSVDLDSINFVSLFKGIINWDDGSTPIGRVAHEDINIGYESVSYDGEGN